MRQTVEVRIANGNSVELIGCDRKTLRKYFGPELKAGRDRMIARVGASVHDRRLALYDAHTHYMRPPTGR